MVHVHLACMAVGTARRTAPKGLGFKLPTQLNKPETCWFDHPLCASQTGYALLGRASLNRGNGPRMSCYPTVGL